MSQKEDVATNNEEAKVRCIHWAKNLRRTLHADLYENFFFRNAPCMQIHMKKFLPNAPCMQIHMKKFYGTHLACRFI